MNLVVCREVARLLVPETEGEGVGPARSVVRISHSSTKGGAGEDEEGTWISRKSAWEVRTKKKYPGSKACEFMGTNLVGEPIASVGGGAVGETRVEVSH